MSLGPRSRSTESCLLTVVVVAYNSESAIEQTVASLTDAVSELDSEIILIDNASSDGTAELAERTLGDQGRVIRMSEDLGFAAGINEGARRAQGKYLLMMNDDVIVTPGNIERLITTLQERPTVAMMGPVLCHPDGSPTYSMYRWLPGWRDEISKVRDRALGSAVRTTVPKDVEVVEVGVLFGACALIETEFFRSIGGLNDVFFVYGSDLDLCRRITSLGYAVALDTRAFAIHHQDEELARRPKGREFSERLMDARDIYYRIWLSRISRVMLHLWHTIGRDNQPYRAIYHVKRAFRTVPSLRWLRRPPPLDRIEEGT